MKNPYAKIPLFIIPTIILFSGCKQPTDSEEDNPKPKISLILEPKSNALLNANEINLVLDSSSNIYGANWISISDPFFNQGFFLYTANLWLSAMQNGNSKSVFGLGIVKSNLTSESYNNKKGIYSAWKDSLSFYSDWPEIIGCPRDLVGKPKIYGDQMVWASFNTYTQYSANNAREIFGNNIVNLKVTVYLFSFKANPKNIVFVRYELKNIGTDIISNTYLGFRTDTDLDFQDGPDIGENATYFDKVNEICFTYDAHAKNGKENAGKPTVVSGQLFCDVPSLLNNNKYTYSSRELRKSNYTNPDFGEGGIQGLTEFRNSLLGLSNSGLSMIDSVTKETTLFAFTGDPLTNQGWIDVDNGTDTRNIISYGSFEIQPGETKTIVIAMGIATGSNLENALSNLRKDLNSVKSKPDLWK